MKKIINLITILILFLSIALTPAASGDVEAAISCPTGMSDIDCYEYLNKKLSELQKSQGSLQNRLKDEDYQQLSLQEKINYINGQISQTEKVIDTLEVEIASKDMEIKLFSKEIQTREDNLSTLNQEISILEETVNERITESYKYSFVSAFEIFFDTKNISSVLRKTKYLLDTRQKDKQSLEEFNTKTDTLKEEEEKLAVQRADLQKKRNDIESEKSTLITEKNNLDSQKAEKNRLLAESQKREQEYRAQLVSVQSSIAEADNIVSDLIIKLFNSGGLKNGQPVTGGSTVLGAQGHTGCSFGSHLHFEIRNSAGTKLDPSTYLSGGTLWTYVNSKVYSAPLSGGMLTQGYKSTHRAWDMVSMRSGDQSGSTYTVPRGICPQVESLITSTGRTYAYLTGEGAPIRAIASGTVYYGVDNYGGKYALVKHNDGNTSLYLHLR